MKILVVSFIVLLAAVGLALFAIEDPGYVLIARAPWTVEMPFTFFAALVVVAVALSFFLLRILVGLWRTPRAIGVWRQQRSLEKRQQSLVRGYAHMLEGDWAQAEKDLVTRIDHSQTPLLGYVGAAYSAQQQGDVDKRDGYLARAEEADPKRSLAIGLIQARMQYQNGQLEQALASLEHLRTKAPKNIRVFALLADVLRTQERWNELVELLPALRKNRVFADEELESRSLEAYAGLLAAPETAADTSTLKSAWEKLPGKRRRSPRLVAAYAKRLIGLKEMKQAESLLRGAIKKQWDADLVFLYGLVKTTDIQGQFKIAESWTGAHPDDPSLMLTLGRLAMENRLWGKARSYLETCIANNGPDEAHRVLGSLLEGLGETAQALHCYRQGLARATPGTLPALPEVAAETPDGVAAQPTAA